MILPLATGLSLDTIKGIIHKGSPIDGDLSATLGAFSNQEAGHLEGLRSLADDHFLNPGGSPKEGLRGLFPIATTDCP